MAHTYTTSNPTAPSTAPAPGGGPRLQPADAPLGRAAGFKDDLKLGFLDLSSLQHLLRIRKTVVTSDQLKLDLGLDYSLKQRASKLLAMLSYELRRNGKPLAVLRATPYELVARKSWPVETRETRIPKTSVTIPKLSANVHAIAGFTYDGRPSFGLDVDQVKPAGLIVAAAVTLLALGKPLSQSRAFEVIQFALPQNGATHAKVEGRLTVQKKGNGLKLGLNQINPIIRL